MLHARMIRPPVAGAVPVKVDEASIKDIPGAKVVWDKGFLAVVADKEWDAIRAADKLKVEWSDAKPAVHQPRCALRSHPQDRAAQDRGRRQERRQRRRRVQDRGARDRGRVRVAVPVARLHGSRLLGRGDRQGRQRHLLERNAEVAFRAAGRRQHARHPGQQGADALDDGSGLLRPQRRRRLRRPTRRCWRR